MTTLQRFPEKGARRAVKQVTLNVDAEALTGTSWELLNEAINYLFSIGNVEAATKAPAKVRRDYHAIAKIITRPMRISELIKALAAHAGVTKGTAKTNYWPAIRGYIKETPEGYVYDEATAREYEAKAAH